MKSRNDCSGVTLVEVLVAVAVLVIVAGLLLPRFFVYQKPARIKCVNNLKNVGLAFRIFATDNNERFPAEVMRTNGVPLASIDALRVYLTLSNELSTPMLLCCPVDTKRKTATSMATMALNNISYFASVSTEATMPQGFLAGDRNLETNGVAVAPGVLAVTTGSQLSWTEEIHNEQGNIAMGDGSVQLFTSERLKQGILDQGAELATNYLVVP